MSLRAACVVVAVLLSGCSMVDRFRSPDDGPQRLKSRQETIHSVDPEPAPARGFPQETRTLGNDPRRRAAAEARAPAEGPPRAGGTPAWQPQDDGSPVAPMAGRVGVMSLLENELRHIHAGAIGGHQKAYKVQYDFNGYVLEELRKSLVTKTPYQPVAINSTGLLRRDAAKWAATWDGKAFAPEYQREFDGIIKQNRLSMLIVISYRTMGDGQLVGGRKLYGSGLYTRRGLGGTRAAVFSTLQFYRLVDTPARMVLPLAPAGERSIGDLPDAKLPEELENLPPRYLAPVYEPLRTLVQNKVHGLVSLPRKLGH